LKQKRHEQLIELLNKYSQYGNLLKYPETRSTMKAETYLDVNEINWAVIVFTDVLNMGNGSTGTIDLYKLLQSYLLDVKKRNQINAIVKGNYR
jgi:hypothetical protein